MRYAPAQVWKKKNMESGAYTSLKRPEKNHVFTPRRVSIRFFSGLLFAD